MLEPQRSNLVTYSEDLTQWSNLFYTLVESNSTLSPDGNVNADKLVAGATNGLQLRIAPLSLTSGNTYTFSTYVKNSGGNYVILYINDSSSQGMKVDLVNETFVIMGSATNQFIKNFGNGWYQIGFTRTIDANVSGLNTVASLDGNNVSFLGDGVNGVYLWGAQAEQGSYATSYIPTSGSAVTRVAEVCNNGANDQVINSTEGVLYADISADEITTGRWLSLSNGTTSERLSFGFQGSTIRVYIKNTSGLIWDAQKSGIDILNYNKVGLKYKSGDYALWINGTEIATSSNSNLTSGLNSLQFNAGSGAAAFYGNIKDLKLYNTALTDQELAALTTI